MATFVASAFESLTISSVSLGLTAATYLNSSSALVYVATQPIYFRLDGGVVTSTNGFYGAVGALIKLNSAGLVSSFRAIRATANDAVIKAQYGSGLDDYEVVSGDGSTYITNGAAGGADGTTSNQTTLSGSGANLIVYPFAFNGTNWDRMRSSQDASLLASASRTTTQTSGDIQTYGMKAITAILDMTVVGTGSVTISINGKDPASLKYFPILAGAAVITNSTNVYQVGPGLTNATNLVANAFLPHVIQIVVTANNANPATYSVGYSMLAGY